MTLFCAFGIRKDKRRNLGMKGGNYTKEYSRKRAFYGDEEIIDMYWKRNPDAIHETAIKYGSMLQSVAYNILSDIQDCEECQNDTLLKLWNAIPSARPNFFPAYIIQVIRQVAIGRYREKSRMKRIPSQLTLSLDEVRQWGGEKTIEEEINARELGRLITEYVQNLDEELQHIFIDYFYLSEPIEKTASELHISKRTAYRKIEGIKQDLKKHLERNGVCV